MAEYAGADRMMTSRVVRTLMQAGLIDREAHETDGRAVRLSLTPAGRELGARAIRVAQQVDRRFFGSDAPALRDSLRAIAQLRGADAFSEDGGPS